MAMSTADISKATRNGQTSKSRDSEDQIYDSIRHAVLTQQLHSGTRLPELTLSEIFGVNRSIVRRALVRLANNHIIVMRRNQSSMVASPSPEETAELFAARRHVEAQVMRETAGQLNAAKKAELERIVFDENEAHDSQHHDNRIHLSLDFHQSLADACPNQVMGRILQDLILRTSIAVALYKVPGMAACYRSSDHRSIADAILDGDAEHSAQLACEHLDYLEDRLNYNYHNQQADLTSILGSAAS